MSVTLKPINEIKAHLGIEPNGRVQKFFTETCARRMDKYVPYDSGMLRKIVIVEDDSITYASPYAHYMYKGELYVDPNTGSSWAGKNVAKVPTGIDLKYHTPGTGSYWDKTMWSAEGQEIVKEVQAYIDRGGR